MVAAELGDGAVAVEQLDQGDVPGDPPGVRPGGLDVALPQRPAVALAGTVRLRLRQHLQEPLDRRRLAQLVEQVEAAGRVAQDLQGLDAGQVVEEPAARRVHQQRVPLALQQRQGLDLRRQVAGHVLHHELVDGRGAQQHVDVGVAGLPRVAQHLRGPALEHLVGGVAQQVEGVAQRPPPGLVPARLASGVAAAVLQPAPDTVDARPGRQSHLGLPVGRVLVEPGAQPGRGDVATPGLDRHGVGHAALGEVVVVAERLAVGGDGDEAALPVVRALALGPLDDAVEHHLAGEAAEGHVVGDVAVVDHQVDAEVRAGRVAPPVDPAGVEAGAVDRRLPLGLVALVRQRPDGRHLARRQDREPHALLGQHLQHPVVDRGLGEPHALGLAAEAVTEVGLAPTHLRAEVTVVAERQDGVPVGLGYGPTLALVGGQDALVGLRGVGLQPRQQGRSHVEGQVLVVVDDGDDAAGLVEDAGPAVGAVRLGGDAGVPVVERGGRHLAGHHLCPGVLPGRLVEVAVEHESDVRHSSPRLEASAKPETAGGGGGVVGMGLRERFGPAASRTVREMTYTGV